MNEEAPKVTIGLPVCNGARYLSQAIDCYLAQTWSDFELIISDNASTDETEDICRAYEERDPRVRYVRNKHNIGAGPNFDQAFRLSRSPYFKWAAHDDVCAPEFLERCVDILDQDTATVVAYAEIQLIDEGGVPLRYDKERCAYRDGHGNIMPWRFEPQIELSSNDPVTRFQSILRQTKLCYEIFGLIRASALHKTSLMQSYYGSDKVLLTELGMLGPFQQVPERLFSRRCHLEQSSARAPRENAHWISGTRPGLFVFPQWRLLVGYLKALGVTKLNYRQKLRGLKAVIVHAIHADSLKHLFGPTIRDYLTVKELKGTSRN